MRRASKQRNPTYRGDCRLPSDVNLGEGEGFVNATAFTVRLPIHSLVMYYHYPSCCSSLIPRWAHYTHYSTLSGLLGVTTSLHLRMIVTLTHRSFAIVFLDRRFARGSVRSGIAIFTYPRSSARIVDVYM